MNIENLGFFKELDAEQRSAVTAEENAVVSAGAGSGKTKVLSARYGYLIMTGACEVDQILTITFTNKAANEMYRRIYLLLTEHASENEYARKAVENFHKARISTLDSFCLGVARNAARHFGISPVFESNETKVKEMARSLALRFVLDKRNVPALQQLIAEKKMQATADELFVKPVFYHSTVSSPLDFADYEKRQREEILKRWKTLVRKTDEIIALFLEKLRELQPGSSLYEYLVVSFSRKVQNPDLAPLFSNNEHSVSFRDGIIAYCKYLEYLSKCKKTYIKKPDLYLKEAITKLRIIINLLKALASNAFQWDIIRSVFPLIGEFEEILNRKKREAGILTFNDIARLAVDGLRKDEDLRRMYRNSFRMIMIDEFQDNNSLQRDLVDLLADPAKVFYVGDEKQSIYRFRGADVSVFRSLADNTGLTLSLNRNYRSRPILIRSFNLIFGGLLREDESDPLPAVFPPYGTKTKAFEATYRWIKSREDTKTEFSEENLRRTWQQGDLFTPMQNARSDTEPRFHFAFFDKGRRKREDSLKPEDHEAFYIAKKIRDLCTRKIVYDKDKGMDRPSTFGDFAVLMRSNTHQHSLERAFKKYGIPYNTDRPASLFEDAPLNDLRIYLKLLVYPNDKIAYGALLRSPFVRLSEDAFTLCMLYDGTVFDESMDEMLAPSDRIRYREAGNRYRELLSAARNLPISSLITKLWYEYGYRHEALWCTSAQAFLDLYDLFFEQARNTEEQGGTLVDFLDYVEELAINNEKPDDSTLPNEEGSGVRIMTIHRSKGLEFPVVFLYNCGSIEKTSLGEGLAFYSDRRGVFLKLPRSEEWPDADDYFYMSENKEERDKINAELRRFFYVALTRAEDSVFVTAAIPKQTKEEQSFLGPEDYGGYGKQYITERFKQYKRKQDIKSLCFLRLLPVLSDDNPLYTIEAIDCHRDNIQEKNDAGLSLKEEALRVMPDYETIPAVTPHHFIPYIVSASSLHIQPGTYSSALSETPEYSASPDDLFTETGIEAEEFGTIVHSFIEAFFNGETPKLPSHIASSLSEKNQKALTAAVLSLAEGFFSSPLGSKARSASFRKTEYPILTAVEGQRRRIIVSGKIDLLFDDGSSVYVVDFKTDKDEDITRHVGQLAVYKRAVEDIFNKPAECRLFFLRSGHEADVAAEIGKTSPEELVAMWEKDL